MEKVENTIENAYTMQSKHPLTDLSCFCRLCIRFYANTLTSEVDKKRSLKPCKLRDILYLNIGIGNYLGVLITYPFLTY